MCGSENLEALTHRCVVDDTDIAHVGEIGVELHLQTVGEAVNGVKHMYYLAHGYAWREY